MTNRNDWYRMQCSLYATRLGEWLLANSGRKTKSRTIIQQCEIELGRYLRSEEEAYQALLAVEEVAWSAPEKAGRVIVKAMRPSESYTEFLNRRK